MDLRPGIDTRVYMRMVSIVVQNGRLAKHSYTTKHTREKKVQGTYQSCTAKYVKLIAVRNGYEAS